MAVIETIEKSLEMEKTLEIDGGWMEMDGDGNSWMVDGYMYGLTLGDTRTPSTSPTYFVLCKPPMDKHDHDEYIPFVSGLSYFCTNPAQNLSYTILSKSITGGKKAT